MLTIWKLEAIDGLDEPWGGRADCYYTMIVAAATEEEARQIASENSGDEFSYPWLDPDLTTCLELLIEEPGLIARKK